MKTLDIILICFFFLFIIGGVLLMQYARSEGSKCTIDPLTYYEIKTNDNCACYCSSQLYAGQNYKENFNQQYAKQDNVTLSLFNKTLGNLS